MGLLYVGTAPANAGDLITKGYADGLGSGGGTPPYAADVPAGSASTLITHNLDTRDIQVTVYDKSTDPWEIVEIPYTVPTGGNTVTLEFGIAPTSGQYRVVVSSGSGGGSSGPEFTPVFFEANVTGNPTVNRTSFETYPINYLITNEGGGSFDTGTYIYTIPSNGVYDCQATVRITDNQSVRSFGLGIGVGNSDGAHFLWGQMGGMMRDAKQYRRITRFNAGELVRLYIYSDGSDFPVSAGNLVIRKVGV